MADIKRVIDQDGVVEEYQVEDGRVYHKRIQPVGAFHKYSKERQSQVDEHGMFKKNDGLYHAARIPLVEVERWKKQYGFDWFAASEPEKKAWLNGPHCAPYRLQRSKV